MLLTKGRSPWKMKNKWDKPCSCFSVFPQDRFQATPQRKGMKGKLGSFPELRRLCWESREAQTARGPWAVRTLEGKESHKNEDRLGRSADDCPRYFGWVLIRHACVVIAQGWGQNCLKGFEETISGAENWNQSPFPPAWLKSLTMQRHHTEAEKRFCFSIGSELALD